MVKSKLNYMIKSKLAVMQYMKTCRLCNNIYFIKHDCSQITSVISIDNIIDNTVTFEGIGKNKNIY